MTDGFFVMVVSFVIIGLATVFLLSARELNAHKQEAFDRGFMIECVGKKGYYWDCEQ